jgi:hypothetical protein
VLPLCQLNGAKWQKPLTVAAQVRNMAKTRRLSSNRILGLIENGIEAEKCKRDESAGMRKSRILTPTHLPDVPKTQTSRRSFRGLKDV